MVSTEIWFRYSFLQKTGHRSPLQIRKSSENSRIISKLDLIGSDLRPALGKNPGAFEHMLERAWILAESRPEIREDEIEFGEQAGDF